MSSAHAPSSQALLPLQWFLAQLLADDRFLLRAATLKSGIAEKCEEVASLPDSFWKRIAEVGGIIGKFSAWEVRHRTMQCMYKGLCYLDCNGFAPLGQYPLSLTQGDIQANLSALDLRIGPLDVVTQIILLCYRLDPGAGRTIEAVRLLQRAPGSVDWALREGARADQHRQEAT